MRRRADLHAGLVAWQKMIKADRKRDRYFGVGRKKLRAVEASTEGEASK